MSINIYTTDFFDKELKKLAKKYPSIKSDYKALLDSLNEEPKQGKPLGKDCYKVRMAINKKEKGKAVAAVLLLALKSLQTPFSCSQFTIKRILKILQRKKSSNS